MRITKLKYLAFLSVVTLLTMLFSAAPAWAAATYTIDASGGQCSQIGTWNAGAKTCTLNQGVTETGNNTTIEITADGITLEGNNKALRGSGSGTAVYLAGRKDVTIKELNIYDYQYAIQLSGSGADGQRNVIEGNYIFNVTDAIYLTASSFNDIIGNFVKAGVGTGITLSWGSSSNRIQQNSVGAQGYGGIDGYGINLDAADDNIVSGNFIYAASAGLRLSETSDNNGVFHNQFFNAGAQDDGSGNYFSIPLFGWGNYWNAYDTPAEGCHNFSPFDDFCDSPLPIGGLSPATDIGAYPMRGAWSRHDFTWYDSKWGMNWILVANAERASDDLWVDLYIDNSQRNIWILPDYAFGQVPPGKTSLTRLQGTIGGPVEVIPRDSSGKPVVSSRTLWPVGGSSLEEVNGTEANRLSDTFWWPWYDMLSPGFQNWIMISNPNSFTVDAEISFMSTNGDISGYANYWNDVIAAGEERQVTFAGWMGGPVKVNAFVDDGTKSKPAKVMASQRVLSNGGLAFNEVPGIPDAELTDYHYWTWYDQVSPGAQNWIMIANPATNSQPLLYDIYIGDEMVVNGTFLAPSELIPVGGYVFRTFPGKIGGPVQVLTYYDGGAPANSIASQRVVWGPSFEEVPGKNYYNISDLYDWTWYDQSSAGAQNWVMVANPNNFEVIATVMFTDQAGQLTYSQSNIAAGDTWQASFPQKMGGPVVASGVKESDLTPADVIASQRVLWNGYFNEVWGQ